MRNIASLSATLTLVTPTLKMSTQHTGDGPPRDDDFYDSVEEESIRATGSGRNPNAAAWDPEKMEPAPGSGGEESSPSKASGACSPPQDETARILGEGCCRLVQAG